MMSGRCGLAGEGDQRDVRVLDQGVAGLLADAVDDVEHAVGHARLAKISGHRRRRQRGALGGLEHHACSRTPGAGASFQLSSMNGVFHGRDEPGDALGLADHVAELVGRALEGVLAQGDDHVGEVAEVLRRPPGLAPGLGDRQPGVERLEARRAASSRASTASAMRFRTRARARAASRPRAVGKRGPGGRRRPGRRRPRIAARGLRVGRVGHRVGDVEGRAAVATAPSM